MKSEKNCKIPFSKVLKTGRMIMNIVKIVHDPFCWKCCGANAKFYCSECMRSFHDVCWPNIEKQEDWLCPVCVELKAAEHSDKQENLRMLPLIMGRVMANKSYDPLKQLQKGGSIWKNSDKIVNPINLTMIKNKIESYKSFAEYRADFLWIQHNCLIAFGSESHEKIKAARLLTEAVNEEIESVMKCAECYENATKYPDTWFAMVCKQPHLIVWSKLAGFNFWPAKLMSIDGQLVSVRFFGDHTNANVPATSCYLYCENDPNKGKSTSSRYLAALKEADAYIENLRITFGSFRMAKPKTLLNPALFDRYICDMIPSLDEHCESDSGEQLKHSDNENSIEDSTDESIQIENSESKPIVEPQLEPKQEKTQNLKRRSNEPVDNSGSNVKTIRFNEKNHLNGTEDEKSNVNEKFTKNDKSMENGKINIDVDEQMNGQNGEQAKNSDANQLECVDSTNAIGFSNASITNIDEMFNGFKDAVKAYIEQQLIDTKEKLNQTCQINDELRKTGNDLQQNLINIHEANIKLIEKVTELNRKNAELKMNKDNRHCITCGQSQSTRFFCTDECYEKHVETLIMKSADKDNEAQVMDDIENELHVDNENTSDA